MLIIEKGQTVLVNGRTLTAEASDLEMPPGEWPDFIAVMDMQNKGFLFQKISVDEEMGRYTTEDGSFELHIFND